MKTSTAILFSTVRILTWSWAIFVPFLMGLWLGAIVIYVLFEVWLCQVVVAVGVARENRSVTLQEKQASIGGVACWYVAVALGVWHTNLWVGAGWGVRGAAW